MFEDSPRPIGQKLNVIDDLASGIAERSYNQFAARFETEASTVHRDRFCAYIIPDMASRLADAGLDAAKRVWRDRAGISHHYLETRDGIIIDPTWQQFLRPDTSSEGLPKVLVSRREDLEGILWDLDVPPEQHRIWTEIQDEADWLADSDGSEEWGWSSDRRHLDADDPDEEWPRQGFPEDDDPTLRPYDNTINAHEAYASVTGIARTLQVVASQTPTPEAVQVSSNTVTALIDSFAAHAAQFPESPVADGAIQCLVEARSDLDMLASQAINCVDGIGGYLRSIGADSGTSQYGDLVGDNRDAGEDGVWGEAAMIGRIAELQARLAEIQETMQVAMGQFNEVTDGSSQLYSPDTLGMAATGLTGIVYTADSARTLLLQAETDVRSHFALKRQKEERLKQEREEAIRQAAEDARRNQQ